VAGSHGAVQSRASPTSDGTEGESDAQQSVHEEQGGIRSRQVIEYVAGKKGGF
jgi:hypothetical protein